MESLWAAEKENLLTKQDNTDSLKREFESMKKELRLLVTDTVGTPLKIGRPSKNKSNNVEKLCPNCSVPITYRQKAKAASVKALKCASCNSQLFSRFDELEGFIVEARTVVPVEAVCLKCAAQLRIPLDTFPGSSVITTCATCETQMRISRARDGIRIAPTPVSSPPKLKEPVEPTEEIILTVKEHLPLQPWPKDTHKALAAQLGLSKNLVYKSMSELIRRGFFKPQIDGKLYVAESTSGSDVSEGQTLFR